MCELAALGAGSTFNPPLATTSGLNTAENKVGYYTFTAVAQDKAGNRSVEAVRTAVNDDDDPNVGVIIGGYAKRLLLSHRDVDGQPLDQEAYWAEARFAGLTGTQVIGDLTILNGGLLLPREGGVAVDAYNVDGDLSQSELESPKVKTFRGLQHVGKWCNYGTPIDRDCRH